MRKLMCFGLLLSSMAFAAIKVDDFAVSGSDGKNYSLKNELKGNEAAVVVFVATKCPYSNAYNGRYNELAAKLKAKKVAFFPINSNDTEPLDDVKKHATENKFAFTVMKDDQHKVADLFKAEKTPEAFLLNKQGEVVYHGRIDEDGDGKNANAKQDLLAAVDEYLTKKTVTVKETKAFGCSIKRK